MTYVMSSCYYILILNIFYIFAVDKIAINLYLLNVEINFNYIFMRTRIDIDIHRGQRLHTYISRYNVIYRHHRRLEHNNYYHYYSRRRIVTVAIVSNSAQTHRIQYNFSGYPYLYNTL